MERNRIEAATAAALALTLAAAVMPGMGAARAQEEARAQEKTPPASVQAADLQVQRGSVSQRNEMDSSRLELSGQAVRLRVDQLPAPGPDHERLEGLGDGEVLGLVHGKPFKFWTDADLLVDGQRIAAHNHGPTYPGVYSLWLKRQDDGWKLVFNRLADVWGTMHDPGQDVAEAALEVRALAEPATTTEAELEANGDDGGTLRIRWGAMEWSTPFRLAP